MKFSVTLTLILLLSACHFSSVKPVQLVGSWRATQIRRGHDWSPLGRPYDLMVRERNEDNLLEVVLSGCSTENFIYRTDRAHLSYVCGEPGAMCLNNLMSCGFRRIDVEDASPIVELPNFVDENGVARESKASRSRPTREPEKCSDKLPYCAKRIRQDDELLIGLLRTASSWRSSGRSLVLSSEARGAEVTFERANPTLSKSQVIALVNAEATKRKVDLAKFSPPSAEFHPSRNIWSVAYTGVTPGPGNAFSATVDDSTNVVALFGAPTSD